MAGETATDIAAEYGVAISTLSREVPMGRYAKRASPRLDSPKTKKGRTQRIPDERFRLAFERAGSVAGAAKRLGCCPETVTARLGLRRPMPRPYMPVGEMRRLYEAGESCKAIAALAECSEGTVRNYLLSAGVVLRRAGGSSPGAELLRRRDHAVCLLYQSGVPLPLIAEVFGVSHPTMSRFLAERDVPTTGAYGPRSARPAKRRLAEAVRDGHLVAQGGHLVRRTFDAQTVRVSSTAQEGAAA